MSLFVSLRKKNIQNAKFEKGIKSNSTEYISLYLSLSLPTLNLNNYDIQIRSIIMLGLDQVQQMHLKQKELRIEENSPPVSYYPLKLGKSVVKFKILVFIKKKVI